MINFRYHLVSLAAVFLALAVGLVLGARYFETDGSTVLGSGPGSSATGLAAFEAGYADRTGGALLNGVLNGKTVLLVTLPNAEKAQVDDVGKKLGQAGATVAGQIGLTNKLVDGTNRQFAESVAGQADSAAVGSGFAKVGATLAKAYVGKPPAAASVSSIVSAFTEGGLIDVATAPSAVAAAVVVVGGASDAGSPEVLGELLEQFAGRGPAVLAGPSAAGAAGGWLADVRSNAKGFSTVDVTDASAGRVVVVLALAKTATGTTGSWGTDRAGDGPLP